MNKIVKYGGTEATVHTHIADPDQVYVTAHSLGILKQKAMLLTEYNKLLEHTPEEKLLKKIVLDVALSHKSKMERFIRILQSEK